MLVAKGWAMLGFLAVLTGVHLWLWQPEASVPAEAGAEAFSAERAMRHVERTAALPHPVGSAEHGLVREHVVKEVEKLGLRAEVQTTLAAGPGNAWSEHVAATVRNVVVRVPGTGGGVVLVEGHYDSGWNGPGAGSGGATTAAMLETLRALGAGPPLRNDVVFLFADGEALGGLGKQVFRSQHPFAKEIGPTLRFTARGIEGPTMLLAAEGASGWLVRQYGEGVKRPAASSVTAEAARYAGDADFGFRSSLTGDRGSAAPLLTFGFAEGWPADGTVNEQAERLNADTLQHHGDTMLALVRKFGNAALAHANKNRDLTANVTASSAATAGTPASGVYFSVFGIVVHWSAGWAVPLAVGAVVGAVAMAGYALLKRLISWQGLAYGLVPLPAAVFGAYGGIGVVWDLIAPLWGERLLLPSGAHPHAALYQWSFLLLAVALTFVLFAWYRRRLPLLDLFASTQLLCAATLAVCAFLFPGASYLLQVPLLFTLAITTIALLRSAPERILLHPLALFAVAAPLLTLLLPATFQLFTLLPIAASSVAILPAVFGTALLLPCLEAVRTAAPRFLPATAALASFSLLVITGVHAHPNEHRPLGSHLFYHLNAADHSARFASSLPPDAFTQSLLNGPAPVVKREPPALEILRDTQDGGERTLDLKVVSKRKAPTLLLRLSGTPIRAVTLNGQLAWPADERSEWSLAAYGIPPGGIDLQLRLPAGTKPVLRVTDVTPGLPGIPGITYGTRAPDLVPSGLYDLSLLVSKDFPL